MYLEFIHLLMVPQHRWIQKYIILGVEVMSNNNNNMILFVLSYVYDSNSTFP